MARIVNRRVPPRDAEDVVQTVLCQALATEAPLEDDGRFRGWLVGLTRHKVADYHRTAERSGRLERAAPTAVDPTEIHLADEWARWAERQVEGDAEAHRSLRWLAREACGEALADIAADERIAPTTVRKRVSRLRRRLRRRWLAELAALAAAVLLAMWALRDLDAPLPSAERVNELDDVLARWRRLGFDGTVQVDVPGRRWDRLSHEHDEIVRVVSGQMLLELDGVSRRLGPGDETLVPAGREHSITNVGDTELRWLYGTRALVRP